MNNAIQTITGNMHEDKRGKLYFVNDFDMSEVKRMYLICHPDINVKRGWRGHKIEQRWFFVTEGSFEVNLVKIDQWETPDPNSAIETYILSADLPTVLYVPPGYASGFKALIPDSKVMVYADKCISEAVNDDHLYDTSHFNKWK